MLRALDTSAGEVDAMVGAADDHRRRGARVGPRLEHRQVRVQDLLALERGDGELRNDRALTALRL